MRTSLQKAKELYKTAYLRWANELSHAKNVAIAKNIADYVCLQVLGDMGADRGYEFWNEVQAHIFNLSHEELIEPEPNTAIIKYNSGSLALLCSGCSKILKTGIEFTQKEKRYARGELVYLDPMYCETCKPKDDEHR